MMNSMLCISDSSLPCDTKKCPSDLNFFVTLRVQFLRFWYIAPLDCNMESNTPGLGSAAWQGASAYAQDSSVHRRAVQFCSQVKWDLLTS